MTTPAAPATEAVTPPEAEAPVTVESLISDMEKRIAEGRPIVDKEPAEDAIPERSPEAVDVGEQAGDGKEVGGGEEADPGEEEGDEEEAGQSGEEEEGEGEEELKAEGEEEEDDDEDVFIASIPGRRPGDPDLKLEVAGLTQEETEAINRLRNGYLRGEDYRAQLEAVNATKAEVDFVAQQMDLNPAGYINEVLGDEQKVELVKFLLTNEKVFDSVFPEIERWENDKGRREGEAAKIERDILKRNQAAVHKAQANQAAREQGDAIVRHLEDLGESLSEAHLGRYMRFALQDLDDFVKANPKASLDLETVNMVLKRTGVFESFGIKPTVKKAPAKGPSRAKSPRDRLAEAKGRVEEARKTSERFKKKRARKRSAGTSPPGSGPGPVTPPFKKGETIEERIAYIEKHGIPRT
jgi:hypothetical protein